MNYMKRTEDLLAHDYYYFYYCHSLSNKSGNDTHKNAYVRGSPITIIATSSIVI